MEDRKPNILNLYFIEKVSQDKQREGLKRFFNQKDQAGPKPVTRERKAELDNAFF